MAAHVVAITDPEQWQIIHNVLAELVEGGIVIGPAAAAAFERMYGQPVEERLIEYDFGEQPDVFVDYTNDSDLDHFCIQSIATAMSLAQDLDDM